MYFENYHCDVSFEAVVCMFSTCLCRSGTKITTVFHHHLKPDFLCFLKKNMKSDQKSHKAVRPENTTANKCAEIREKKLLN